MLKIRLQRIGKKHQPNYRLVLIDSRKPPKSGAFLEILGNYNPYKGEVKLNEERIRHWISAGAQVSDTVHNFLVDFKLIEGRKKNVIHSEKIKEEKKKNESEKEPEGKKEEEKIGEEAFDKSKEEKESEKDTKEEKSEGEEERKEEENENAG